MKTNLLEYPYLTVNFLLFSLSLLSTIYIPHNSIKKPIEFHNDHISSNKKYAIITTPSNSANSQEIKVMLEVENSDDAMEYTIFKAAYDELVRVANEVGSIEIVRDIEPDYTIRILSATVQSSGSPLGVSLTFMITKPGPDGDVILNARTRVVSMDGLREACATNIKHFVDRYVVQR